MKRKLIFAAGFILLTLSFSSCEKSCRVCQQNTYKDGSRISSGSETEYCGAELIAIEATGDVTVGSTTTKWECR